MTDTNHEPRGAADPVAPSGVGIPEPTPHCEHHGHYMSWCVDCVRQYRSRYGGDPTPNAMPRHRTRHRNEERRSEGHDGTRPGIGTRTRPESEKARSTVVTPIRASRPRPESEASDSDMSGTRPGHVPMPQYFDVSALLAGTLPEPPTPTVCPRTDGIGLFYSEQYNVVFGDPESGKTLLTDHATVVELEDGGRVLRIDLDHNGPQSTIGRLLAMGAKPDVLSDPEAFLYIEPEDAREVREVCAHMAQWRPTLVILDSLGELLPMFGSNSNSADEFTTCHRAVIKPLVKTGACVVGIDHLSKGADSRAYGMGGTIAKKRAIGGSSIRVTVDRAFTPGKGGSAYLAINKDRHGGLRAHSPSTGDKEELAGKFVLWPEPDGHVRAEVKAPEAGERNPGELPPDADIAAIAALDPPPTSGNEAAERLPWRATRARAAFKAWKSQGRNNEESASA